MEVDLPQNFITEFIEKKLSQPAADQAYAHLGDKNLGKGLLAGLAGGVAGTLAKSLAERLYPPRTHGEPIPTEVAAEKLAGHELAQQPKQLAGETIHWVFGASAGAAYGMLAEFYPAATSREGANFGMTLMALTHEGALPAMGLSADPADQTSRERSSEVATHIVFGVVTETVRRFIRARI